MSKYLGSVSGTNKLLWLFGFIWIVVGCAPPMPTLAPGTYMTDISIEQVPERFGPPWNPQGYPGSKMVGHWEITFSENGRVFWILNGANNAEGTYSVTSSTLEFGFNSRCNEEDISSGSYRWFLDGSDLTFERIEDDCEGRALGLTINPWIKQK